MTARLSSTTDTNNLYECDYYLWLQHTARLISEGKFSDVDTANLIEEIEDMGRSEKRAIESNLRILLLHLLKGARSLAPDGDAGSHLKYKYQSSKITNSWKSTIREHRKRINKAFKDSPSLKKYLRDVFNECYQDGRELAADETGLPLNTFPEESPFTTSETLNPDYLPQD